MLEQENAGLRSEKAKQEARIAQLEAELEKSGSEKNAGDVALALKDIELQNFENKSPIKQRRWASNRSSRRKQGTSESW